MTILETAIKSGTAFLERQITNMTSEYAIAITTYALCLAKSPTAGDALKLLLTKAKKQGGNVYVFYFINFLLHKLFILIILYIYIYIYNIIYIIVHILNL